MSSFTMYFKDAIEAEPGILTKALTEYPIFNEDYREILNQHIKDNFWNREIGQETPSMFELALRRKMNLIMPIYNKHFEVDLKAAGVDPLQTMKVTNKSSTLGTTVNAGESNSDSSSDAVSEAVNSTYPQSRINDGSQYADNAQNTKSKTTANGLAKEKSESIQKGDSDGEVTGSQGQTSMLLFQHRTTFVNVNQMILEELEELFMWVTSTGDEFSPRGIGAGYGYGYFGYSGHSGLW